MKPHELFELVIAALQTDPGLAGYAQSAYGRPHRVFDAFSGEFPPGPQECPYLLIHSPGKSASRNSREIGHGLVLECFVYDGADETRQDGAAVSSGTVRLLTLMDLARAALLAALPEWIMGYEATTNTVDLWPLLVGTTAYDFEEQVCIGQDPLA